MRRVRVESLRYPYRLLLDFRVIKVACKTRLTTPTCPLTISTVVISGKDINLMDRRESREQGKAPRVTFPPLTPSVFYILIVLAEGERHGYAIMREAAKQSGGTVRLGPGTLYTAIGGCSK